jgi:thiol-disulfide isomerase/thioredoxin
MLLLAAVLIAGCTAASPRSTVSPGPTGASPTPLEGPSQPMSQPGATPSVGAADPLLSMELTDVRSGETFTLAELAADGPVLVETMAIWCTTCRAQMREVVAAHGMAEFISVGIDVDPNERPDDLAAYVQDQGFDWPFVKADGVLVDLLTDRFGFGVTNPPSTPTFVVTADGIRALEFNRVRSAQELIAELGL